MQLPEKERKQLDKVEKALNRKWVEWFTLYLSDAYRDGIAVKVMPGSKEKKVWEELVALRTERNNLLTKFRLEGYNI